MKKLLFLFFTVPLFLFSQEKGVIFEKGLDWTEIKAKAKSENKFIFVDCFTTWCKPCKIVSSTIFPQPKVGEFFNSNFVNVKLQMDRTEQDAPETKAQYSQADRFASEYKVVAYPTFLIFSPQGELVHRILGAGGNADDFIAAASKGLNPKTQYVTMVNNYHKNPNDVSLARDVAVAALDVYDQELAQQATERYVGLVDQTALFVPENVELLVNGVNSTSAPLFAIVSENRERMDELLVGKGISSNKMLARAISKDMVLPKIRSGKKDVDFGELKASIANKYPNVDMTTALAEAKAQYYLASNDWQAFKSAVGEYSAASDKGIDSYTLNTYAWAVFENCDDPACMEAALGWSKESIAKREVPTYVDTYANLLYKSGDKANAMLWQQKAIDQSSGDQQTTFKATLAKMQNDEPTW